jgi:hypothetical protein
MVVFDTATGKPVGAVEIDGGAGDMSYDASWSHVYISGSEGFLDVVDQRDPDHYEMRQRIPVPLRARTSAFSPG